MKKSVLTLGLCLSAALYTTLAIAEKSKESEVLKNYVAEDQYNENNQNISVLSGVRASLKKQSENNFKEENKKLSNYSSLDSDFTSSDPSGDKILLKKDALNIFQVDSMTSSSERKKGVSSAADEQVPKKLGYRVVVNNNTGKVGVLSEKIIVKASNEFKLDKNKFTYKGYPAVGYYIVDIPVGAKITDVVREIKVENKADSVIESIKVEVIENFSKKPL
ncbi:hypothetical protein [Fluviispira multicolorata]|uniref:Uncharacterized protein n=1 Tax=Fluviispira multicolorata TaxID=2654512 RepID=A0A833JD24_9BACT|nr:hypothetical protein [Fluviispira multicolorata]KAB8031051.1 hypothetical protein GCL57_08780 [Fluviispira multicolorata]